MTSRVPALFVVLGALLVAFAVPLGLGPWSALGVALGVVALLVLLDWVVAAPAGEVDVGVDEWPAVQHQRSRSLKRWILPVAVFGRTSTNSNSFGTW